MRPDPSVVPLLPITSTDAPNSNDDDDDDDDDDEMMTSDDKMMMMMYLNGHISKFQH